MPCIRSVYLIRGDYLKTKNDFNGSLFTDNRLHREADMSFCFNTRNKYYFMYVTNQHYYGHLMNLETFGHHLATKLAPEFYQIIENPHEWERVYVHENYSRPISKQAELVKMPCPEVYVYPLVSEQYCSDMIAIVNDYRERPVAAGNCSSRMPSGEAGNFSTDTIQLKQIEFQEQWLFFMNKYVRPMQQKFYESYSHDVSRTCTLS